MITLIPNFKNIRIYLYPKSLFSVWWRKLSTPVILTLKFFFILISSTTFTSCGKKSADELEKEISSGVVLIQNKSFYEAKLPNGNSIYFTNFDKEDGINGLTTNIDSIEMSVSYGSGFFISTDGKIATNHHVVGNKTDDKDITNSISEIINVLKSALSNEYDELYEKYKVVSNLTSVALFDENYSVSEYQELCDYRDEMSAELKSYRDVYSQLSEIKAENSEIIYHNDISIGYNNTFVTNDKDLHSCVIRKIDEERDLAIIQLKNKSTPPDKHIFSITAEDPLEVYGLYEKIQKGLSNDKNERIFMPAFNLGPSLAITSDGLRLQCGEGTISRKTSDDIMYTIPSLPGSSGSPIINQKGEVIAINTSGIRGSDSFNSGVRVKHLYKLMED